jgi:hypothetical protein
MLILTWDQEKIVVLNLVLFCYFLRYLVGDSIHSTLTQRRVVLLDSLLIDLNTQVSLLNKLVRESQTVLNSYNTLLLTLLKKTLANTHNMILANTLSLTLGLNFDFTFVQLSLQAAYDETLSKQLEQNTFVSSQIILDVTPVFLESTDTE